MPAPKPRKTAADMMVIGISPVLIMFLVGSLSFFLIQIFYQGEAAGSVRWVMFWFVLAVVLVSRIGIEQGTTHAAIYGLALAIATWLYLTRVHPAALLGAILLSIIWWSAHKLTWDCTLIDEDEDASGSGLLQTTGERQKPQRDKAVSIGKKIMARFGLGDDRERRAPVPHSPGQWVVYFSLVALPLFGIGQMLLPASNTAARRAGLVCVFVYLAAAVGLLLTTSFLGLRRYLRQRYLQMPGAVAFGWLKFGVGVAGVVLLAALLVPRPGVNDAWSTLRYQVDYRLHQASEFASQIGPHGTGRGRAGGEPQKSDGQSAPASTSQADKRPNADGRSQSQAPAQGPSSSSPIGAGAAQIYSWFRGLLILAGLVLVGWSVFRRRDLLFELGRSLIAAVQQFFRDLFSLGGSRRKTATTAEERKQGPRPFAAYKSPFLTGKDKSWTVEQLVLYSYEALQAWAFERGIPFQPEQTAREFCGRLSQTHPDVGPELSRLALLYGHAAYGLAVPAGCDLEPVRKLWHYLSAVASGDVFADSRN
jgi:hypothetical protein